MSEALRVAFAGTPEFAVPPLNALLASRHRVVGVLTQPDRPAGRGRELSASPVKLRALAAGVPVAQPVSLRDHDGRAALRDWRPDVLVVVAYGLILPPEALAIPRYGCVNIHASLLPRWRGAAPIQRALLAGDEETGVTIMRMDAGLDTGPILLAKRLRIEPDIDAAALHDQLSLLGAECIVQALEGLADGSLTATAQVGNGVSYARKILRAEALMDFSRSAVELERQVRALKIWPIAETRWRGEQLRIHAARALTDSAAGSSAQLARAAGAQSGTVLGPLPDPDHAGIGVLCGNGVLALREVQRAGRRVVSAAEFGRGNAFAGVVLGAAS